MGGGRAVMVGEDGFMGVTGREWCVYQVNTAEGGEGI